MPRYLFSGVHSPQVMERVKEHGLSVAVKNSEAAAAHFGGTVIANYLAFENDGPRAYIVADVPAESVPVLLLNVSMGPAFQPGTVRVVRLLDPDEVDELVVEAKKLPTAQGEPLQR
jgi:hypothetical protein